MALPDLVISDLQINPNNQYEDYPDTINITVQNQGDEIAYLVFVDLFYNIDHSPSPGYDISDDFDWVDEIVPGGSANFSITAYYDEFWTYTFGQFNVYAYVDFDEFIDEDNEGNNVYGPVELGWIQDPTVENYLWPIDPDNAPHNLSSVVNEYREEGGLHTHKGIDIPADDGTNVYSVSSGQVKDLNANGQNSFIRLKGSRFGYDDAFEYIHVYRFAEGNNAIGKWVYSSRQKIAEVRTYTNGSHLHFNDMTEFGNEDDHNLLFYTNPLRTFGLDPEFCSPPYPDDADPQIDDYLRIQPDGSDTSISKVTGKVDFVIRAKDILPTLNTPNNRGGLARIRYSIEGTNISVENVILDGDAVFNNDVLSYLYCTTCGNGDPYGPNGFVYYYITNNITSPYGPFGDSFDSTLLEDGDYVLSVTVEDFCHHTATKDFDIEIDNSGRIEGEGQ